MRPMQLGIAKFNLEQLCSQANCSIKELKFLKNKGLLSFSADQKEFEWFEVSEARFLISLIRFGFSLTNIKKLLASEEPPYSYSNYFYNFVDKIWLDSPIPREQIDEYLSNNLETISGHIEDYIEYLAEEGEEEKIKEILDLLKEKIEV